MESPNKRINSDPKSLRFLARLSAAFGLNENTVYKKMKSDEYSAEVFSQLEKEVAISILKGMPLSKCAHLHGISKLKCQTIVNTYCFKSNRALYDTLRWNPFVPAAPVTELRKHSQIFIDGAVIKKHRGRVFTLDKMKRCLGTW